MSNAWSPPMQNEALHPCRVCGFDQGEPPWGPSGTDPSFVICDCCGAEAGYEDVSPHAAKAYRKDWLARGARWFDPPAKPPDWHLETQMTRIPLPYRDPE